MSGTWTEDNKILPGAYINFKTNTPLSIQVGDRGIVVILKELSVGNLGEIYEITATTDEYPEGIGEAEKMLVNEALKCARTVLLYNLGIDHDSTALVDALNKLRTIQFNTIAYPYTGASYDPNKITIANWIRTMREEEGIKVQGVLANYEANDEAIINVVQGIELTDGTSLGVHEVTAYVAGITAGANINKSNTGQKYIGAIDVIPRMTKTEMEAAITSGKFIFKVDSAQNVTIVYDINSLTDITVEKGKQFTKNRVIRTLDGINNDIVNIFESNYIGKVNNNEDGRSLLRSTLIDYFNELQNLNAIQNFTAEDVLITEGNDNDSVIIDCNIQPVDSVEKMYITVNLS